MAAGGNSGNDPVTHADAVAILAAIQALATTTATVESAIRGTPSIASCLAAITSAIQESPYMGLRDTFAAMALKGLLAHQGVGKRGDDGLAARAFEIADQMMTARGQQS